MVRRIAATVLCALALPLAAEAQDVHVRIVFRTDGAATFEHRTPVRGAAAQRLGSPTPADLGPYITAARKALAEKQGYVERIFGADHHRLARGRVIETTVQDAAGRTVWTSRDPLETEARQAPAVARRTFDPQDVDDGDLGFAPGGGRGKTARRGGGLSRQWPYLR